MNRHPSINHICPLFTPPLFVSIVPTHGIAWQKMIANDRRSMPQILPRHGSDPRLLTMLGAGDGASDWKLGTRT